MKKEPWKMDHFQENGLTLWTCSKCFTGHLYTKTKPVVTSNDRFSAPLRCANSDCKAEYMVSGFVRYFSFEYHMEVSKQFIGKKYKQFYPQYFTPALQLFKLNELIPKKIAVCIDQSFANFWSDIASAANAIRRSLEFLLDDLEEPVPRTSNGQVIPSNFSLHKRIELYADINPDISQSLLAIKWIGNSGSHGEILSKEELLNAYVILEATLDDLFPVADKVDARKLAAEINARKGSRSKN
jgi:hypothetical protein